MSVGNEEFRMIEGGLPEDHPFVGQRSREGRLIGQLLFRKSESLNTVPLPVYASPSTQL